MDPIISVISIDKHSSVPLHAQLRECIRTAIRSGLLAPGDKLPTEEELCSQFAISRPVVRQAYAQLAAEQMIERRRGHGSYVKNVNADTLKLYQLLSFEEEMQLLGKRPGTRLISSETAPGSPQIRRLLQMKDGDLCFRIRRLRTADGLPFCLVDNYVSLARFPGIQQLDFSRESLFRVLESRYGVRIYKACRTMEARIIDPADADLLQVKRRSAASIITSVDYDSQDCPAGLSIEVFPGDSHRFSFTVCRE